MMMMMIVLECWTALLRFASHFKQQEQEQVLGA